MVSVCAAIDSAWQGWLQKWLPLISAALGSAVTTINAFLALGDSKDLWITYRSAREKLLQTLCFYVTGTDIFEGKTTKQQDTLLVQVCEAEMARENGAWRSLKEAVTTTGQASANSESGQQTGASPSGSTATTTDN